MDYSFEGLTFLVIAGMIALFGFALPCIGAAIALIAWRVITADWSMTAAIVGAVIGLLPGIAIAIVGGVEIVRHRRWLRAERRG